MPHAATQVANLLLSVRGCPLCQAGQSKGSASQLWDLPYKNRAQTKTSQLFSLSLSTPVNPANKIKLRDLGLLSEKHQNGRRTPTPEPRSCPRVSTVIWQRGTRCLSRSSQGEVELHWIPPHLKDPRDFQASLAPSDPESAEGQVSSRRNMGQEAAEDSPCSSLYQQKKIAPVLPYANGARSSASLRAGKSAVTRVQLLERKAADCTEDSNEGASLCSAGVSKIILKTPQNPESYGNTPTDVENYSC
ncbi:hypothetical protein Anapl_01866 [Anas platyrhynchos]|uniref:Uncharacterized protein n=1 Tax=Anas platyrhynchos TaxID=8839 RepID=R0KF28_ANAPL|nr:hypothetical protein Anapl_01866 [Anas platyrhynchos]